MPIISIEFSDILLIVLLLIVIYKYILRRFVFSKKPKYFKEWLPIPHHLPACSHNLQSHVETIYYQNEGCHFLTNFIASSSVEQHSINYDDIEVLYLMIPGNPGPCEVYQFFLLNLLQQHPSTKIHSCAVSLLGHDLFNTKHAHNTTRNVSLNEQIAHKGWLLVEWLPKRYKNLKKVILMGHSIGSYMIVNILKRYEEQLQKHYSLLDKKNASLPSLQLVCCFPTFERMLQSPNGQSKRIPVMYGRIPLTFLLHLLSLLLPTKSIRLLLIRILSSWNESVKNNASNPVVGQLLYRFIHPSTVSNLLYLAKQEFLTLKELDPLVPILKKFQHQIFYIFSTQDSWTPLEYVWNLKEKVFGENEQLWKQQTQIESESRHAFCMYREDMKRACDTIINKFELY